VKGSQVIEFLEKALDLYGLNFKEKTDMITYWLPQMQDNKWNLIQFVETEQYEKEAQLQIEPTPDVIIRLFMIFQASKVSVSECKGKLPDFPPTRRGLTVVEWGGMNLDS